MLVELPRLVYDYLIQQEDDARNLIRAALAQHATDDYVDETYQRLCISLKPGRLLVSYFR